VKTSGEIEREKEREKLGMAFNDDVMLVFARSHAFIELACVPSRSKRVNATRTLSVTSPLCPATFPEGAENKAKVSQAMPLCCCAAVPVFRISAARNSPSDPPRVLCCRQS